MAQLGHLALLSALVLSSCALPLDLLGKWRGSARLIQSGRVTTFASCACVSIALIGFYIALEGKGFHAANVASLTWRASSTGHESITPWSGNAHSLLYWLWAQTVIVSMYFGRCREDRRRFCANARVVANLVSVFFLLVLMVETNPFTIFDPRSPGGAAFDFRLSSWPVLMLAYACFAVPLAWSFAWLKSDNALRPYPPLREIRLTILGSWFVLTVGEILSAVMGALLIHRHAGFEGSWLRHVPQNVSLMPWLPATALLCGSRLFKQDAAAATWIVGLSLITFSSCILTTFVGRPDMPAGARRLFVILLIHIWALAAVLVWRRYRRSRRPDKTREARCDS